MSTTRSASLEDSWWPIALSEERMRRISHPGRRERDKDGAPGPLPTGPQAGDCAWNRPKDVKSLDGLPYYPPAAAAAFGAGARPGARDPPAPRGAGLPAVYLRGRGGAARSGVDAWGLQPVDRRGREGG